MRRIASSLAGLALALCLLATPASAQVIIINPPILPRPIPRPTVPPPRVTEYRIQSVEMQAQVKD